MANPTRKMIDPKLSEIFVQLHISEKSGRGVPKIVEIYGEDAFEIKPNWIKVTIPYDRLDLDAGDQDSDQVTGQDSDQVTGQDTFTVDEKRLRDVIDFCETARSRAEIQEYIGISSRAYFRTRILYPLLESGQLHRTIPDKPNSRNQKYISIKQ